MSTADTSAGRQSSKRHERADAAVNGEPQKVLLLGPDLGAVSGVSTHLNLLVGSSLGLDWELEHFQVGSEGRAESRLAKLSRLLSSPLALAARLAMRGECIVHVNTSLEPKSYWRDLVYVVIAKLFGARVLYQVHGGALPRDFFAGNRLLTAWLRASLRMPEAIVVLAQSELAAYRAFVPGQQVVAIPNAIDCSPYEKLARPPQPARSALRLVYVGRLAAVKGLFEALEAVKLAQQRGVPLSFVIAGSGPDEAELRRRVAELQLLGSVSFAGALFDEAKVRLLASSDVFLFPTYHREGLPYALLECMAAGTPAITTRVGGIPDVMDEGVHGLFVPAREPHAIARAIERLHADRAALARMGQACRKRIASLYSVDRLAGDFGRLYGCLTAARRVSPALGRRQGS